MSRTLSLPIVLALAVLPLATVRAADEKKSTELPLSRVVMFSSGVGFYEHNGEMQGDGQVTLKFNVEDINDLLKSMVLQDLGGGKISTVSYESKDPITKTLKTFSIDLTSNPTLADLLKQIRGEKVQVEAPTPISGTIVGVEKRKVRVGKDEAVEQDFLNLLTNEGLRSVNLESVSRIKLLDEKHEPVLKWKLTNAWCTKLSGPTLNAKGNEIAIETLEIAYDRIDME